MHMWQSWVENEHCFVMYFNDVAIFEVLYLRTSDQGGAHM